MNDTTVAIIAAVAAAAGALLTKGVDAMIALLKAKREADKSDQAVLFHEWQELIDSHQTKILRAEERIEGLQKAHTECQVENAKLRSRVEVLEERSGITNPKGPR